jgi:hypothetical protein
VLAGDLGATLLDDGTARHFVASFNAAAVPACWREIEATEGSYYWAVSDKQLQWCKAHDLQVWLGPLLSIDPHGLPDWLYLWEGDFENLVSFVSDYVQATVSRYRGKVDLWVCAGRVNTADDLSLSEEDKLRLAARTVELTRSMDPQTPAVLCFDQPWAEYMSRREMDFPPLHFADALMRAGLDVSGLMLEMNVGYWPGGTLPRTLLELSRQLDYWSVLGLPLFVAITVPSSHEEDPQARRRARPHPGQPTPETQQAWAARYVPLILSKPYVQGILWNQLRDSDPHGYPHGGLFDLQSRPKPALQTLAAIRREHLM